MPIQRHMPSDRARETENEDLPILIRFTFSAGEKSAYGPAIFIDRDGVINVRRAGGYVLDWSQFLFLPDIPEALKKLSSLQLPVIVISNQSAVGRGLMTSAALQQLTRRLQKTLIDHGARLTAAYFCPHTPEEGCLCRKPKPGLLRAAAADFNINLGRSIFIGDSKTDAQAALAVGCQPVLFGPGLNSSSEGMEWVTGLPVALTGKELFSVAADSLRAAKYRNLADLTVPDST